MSKETHVICDFCKRRISESENDEFFCIEMYTLHRTTGSRRGDRVGEPSNACSLECAEGLVQNRWKRLGR